MFLGLESITISKMKIVIGQEFTNLKPGLFLSVKKVLSILKLEVGSGRNSDNPTP
jgi:hypothetical protein